MKDVSIEVLQTPASAPVSFARAGDPFAPAAAAQTSGMPQPFLSADRFQDTPSADDAVYGGVFLTMVCSALGTLLLYAPEIVGAIKSVGYFFANFVGMLYPLD